MRVLIAPDSFKGSLSAPEAAECMARGVCSVFPSANCDLAPVADGGEGTVDALVRATGGTMIAEEVHDPLGRPLRACWGLLGNGRTAVVEMAAASGLPLLHPQGGRDERDALRACTRGTGELIRAALRGLHRPGGDAEPKRLIIGIGGSATNDGGAGVIRALGGRFLDASGRELEAGGAALAELARIDLGGLDPLLFGTQILVACDVDNPLCGPRGASAVFGPQKGADPAMVRHLDAALAHYAEIARAATGKDAAAHPGAGAAGGLGAGLLFFTGAKLRPGVDIVLEAVDFSSRALASDLIITGEGLTDAQTAFGKTPAGVAAAAKRHGKPVLCISGALGNGAENLHTHGIDATLSAVSSITTLEYCMERAAPLLENAVERACRVLKVGMDMKG